MKAPPFPVITGRIPERRQDQKNLTPEQHARLKRGFVTFREAEKKIDEERKSRH